MATIEEIGFCKQVMELAMRITAQGKEGFHAGYIAHVDALAVWRTDQPEGWGYHDHFIYLGDNPATGKDSFSEISALLEVMTKFLETDADGIPL